MKKRVQYLVGMLSSSLLLSLAPVAVVHAATTTGNSGSSASESESETDTSSRKSFADQIKELTAAEGKKKLQADRLKERVAALKIKLTAAEEANLKAKCVTAQSKVKILDDNVDKGVVNRGKAYDELLDRLDKIIKKLEDGDVDVTKLQSQRTELETKITTFKTDLVKYKLALGDLKALGCVADPASFKATLEAARTAREVVATDAKAVRAYVVDTIKPTLKEIKATLQKKSDTEDKDTTTQSGTSPTTTTTNPNTSTSTGGTQ